MMDASFFKIQYRELPKDFDDLMSNRVLFITGEKGIGKKALCKLWFRNALNITEKKELRALEHQPVIVYNDFVPTKKTWEYYQLKTFLDVENVCDIRLPYCSRRKQPGTKIVITTTLSMEQWINSYDPKLSADDKLALERRMAELPIKEQVYLRKRRFEDPMDKIVLKMPTSEEYAKGVKPEILRSRSQYNRS